MRHVLSDADLKWFDEFYNEHFAGSGWGRERVLDAVARTGGPAELQAMTRSTAAHTVRIWLHDEDERKVK